MGLHIWGNHALAGCRCGGVATIKHDLVAAMWAQIFRQAGYQVSGPIPGGLTVPEWSIPDGNGGTKKAKLDVWVAKPGDPGMYLDITIRHPLQQCNTFVNHAAEVPGHAAAVGEQDKRNRYTNGSPETTTLRPLATETYGRHGQEALDTLEDLGRDFIRHRVPKGNEGDLGAGGTN